MMEADKDLLQSSERFRATWPLSDSDQDGVTHFLKAELTCPTIDSLYSHMHWVAAPSGLNIDALHNNIVKGREPVLTEDPELHLVWYKKAIWVKPLPLWLLDADIWDTHLLRGNATADDDSLENIRLHAAGFIRSYTRLIRHESDFLIAKEKNLIPKELPSFVDFRAYTKPFRTKQDDAVSQRFHFGQIRLSRLNWAVRVFQPDRRRYRNFCGRLYYQQLHWDTSTFIQTSIAPFVFIFGTLSVILSSMQVALAVESKEGDIWHPFQRTSWIFSIAILVFIVTFLAVLVAIVTIVLFQQVWWGWQRHRQGTCKLIA